MTTYLKIIDRQGKEYNQMFKDEEKLKAAIELAKANGCEVKVIGGKR